MTNVVDFPGDGFKQMGRAPRSRALEAPAVAAGLNERVDHLDQLIVIGVTKGGALYAASTHPDVADMLLLVERFKRRLMVGNFGDDRFDSIDQPDPPQAG